MSRVKEVVIEIMRHGKPHNQLLSPNTRYLALCGSHPAETLTIPTEHHKIVHLLSRMVDEPGAGHEYQYEREELKSLVTSLLAQLPALPNETRAGADTLVHLRLTITAQELSLLPFELADPPPGVSNGRQPLLIGPRPDVLLTREVRRSARPDIEVPAWFKVLVVVADPDALGLPLRETLEVLEETLTPFGQPARFEGRLVPELENKLITVLWEASLDEVRECCYRETFSHVHFLAHGAELAGRSDAFGIALWDRHKKKTEVVNGEDLARALTPPQIEGGWSQPWCVTLATCDSARQEAIPLWPQTSLAHALHEVGIPTVIASQYPLTFEAAIEMTRTLYGGELRGDDIRFTLRSMRHRIASGMRSTYDWASLATYASWPEDLSAQSNKLRPLRIVQALEVANKWADTAIGRLERKSARKPVETEGDDGEYAEEAIEEAGHVACRRLEGVMSRLEQEAQRIDDERTATQLQWQGRRNTHWFNKRHEKDVAQAGARVLYVEFCGLLGSAWKRYARLRDLLSPDDTSGILHALRQSAYWYGRGTREDRGTHWTACQAFVMQSLLIESHSQQAAKVRQAAKKIWGVALQSATHDLGLDDTATMWAHSSLIEVELWRDFFGGGKPVELEEHVRELIRLAGEVSFPVHATRRQLLRYSQWWFPRGYAPGVGEDLKARVDELLDLFPEIDEKREQLSELESESLLDGLETAQDLEPEDPIGADQVREVYLGGKDPQAGRERRTDGAEPFFRVQLLPARGGDALWIEYGRGDEIHRILIDGGYRTTIRGVNERIRRIARKEGGVCKFDLVVVTHIDADHIEGIVELLGSPLPIEIADLWFNGRRHHPGILGGKHGLFLDTLIERRAMRHNGAFNGGPVVVPDDGEPPEIELAGGMKLTLLSPTPAKLRELAPKWVKHVRDAKLDKATFKEVIAAMKKLHYETGAVLRRTRVKPSGEVEIKELLEKSKEPDKGEENGASIAFVAEFDGRSVLFTGDAHADVLIDTIGRLVGRGRGRRLAVGAVKLSHHGSQRNVSKALLRKLETRTFLVSTNGAVHHHPDREAIAQVVAGDWRGRAKKKPRVQLLFNYASEFTKVWNRKTLMDDYFYEVHYPGQNDVLELSSVPKTP